MNPWAYVALVVAVIAAFGGAYAKGHSAGYAKSQDEIQQSIIEAQTAARFEEAKRWKAALDAAEANVRVEEVIVEKIREVEVEIPTVVERIVEVRPECRDLGAEYAGLLNNQVRAANSVPDTEPAAGVVDGMP